MSVAKTDVMFLPLNLQLLNPAQQCFQVGLIRNGISLSFVSQKIDRVPGVKWLPFPPADGNEHRGGANAGIQPGPGFDGTMSGSDPYLFSVDDS